MAFTVDEIIKNVEYRGMSSGSRKDGKTWMSIRVETLGNTNVRSWEINVPTDLQSDVMNERFGRGDLIQVIFTARAGTSQKGDHYDYLALERVPVLLDVDENGVIVE